MNSPTILDRLKSRKPLLLPAVLTACIACAPGPLGAQEKVTFAVIGDYGYGLLGPEGDVAALVKTWSPDFVVTVGDNNYPSGEASTIDQNIGMHYQEFIYPYTGSYGPGGVVNRFFPALGNHDWVTPGAAPYLAYFQLPGNERYYDIVRGEVHIFIVDSDTHEPDGITSASLQAAWLQSAMTASTSRWKLVFLHHAPYSSGIHGPITQLQWPYKDWGATAVIAGHDHDYERLEEDGLAYFVNGLGGAPYRSFNPPIAGSIVRFTGNYGAMKVEADTQRITFEFVTRGDALVDRLTLFNANITQDSVDLQAGWNLVSLPDAPVDSSAAAVFPGAIAGAYGYDTAGYYPEDTLSRGKGYWVKIGSDTTIKIPGYALPKDTVSLTQGWNLIPGASGPAPAEGVTQDPSGILQSGFYGFSGGYFLADTLRPGKGYWVKSLSAGKIILR